MLGNVVTVRDVVLPANTKNTMDKLREQRRGFKGNKNKEIYTYRKKQYKFLR